MIVSDRHRWVFVHIPKCAGTAVRSRLMQFDDRHGFYGSGVEQHPSLGRIDLGHIPLFALRSGFPEDFARLCEYDSFAIIRDPFERFASSLTQRLKMCGARTLSELTEASFKAEIDKVIQYLSSLPSGEVLLPPEYIHFQRQSQFVDLCGQRIVGAIYRIDQTERLLSDLTGRMGLELRAVEEGAQVRENRAVVFRSEGVRRLVESARPIFGSFARNLPDIIKQRLRNFAYVPRDHRYRELFRTNYVREFIQDFYKDDIALWQEVGSTDTGATRT